MTRARHVGARTERLRKFVDDNPDFLTHREGRCDCMERWRAAVRDADTAFAEEAAARKLLSFRTAEAVFSKPRRDQ
jgi:hypothetical protein